MCLWADQRKDIAMRKLLIGIALFIGVTTAHAGELGAYRLMMLCHIQDPSCIPLLKKTYAAALANPYIKQYPDDPHSKPQKFICKEYGIVTLDRAAFWFFNQMEMMPEDQMQRVSAHWVMVMGLQPVMSCSRHAR